MVFKATLYDVLLEVTVESEDLFVELDEGWLKLSLDVLSCEVVGELIVRVRLASVGFRGGVVS